MFVTKCLKSVTVLRPRYYLCCALMALLISFVLARQARVHFAQGPITFAARNASTSSPNIVSGLRFCNNAGKIVSLAIADGTGCEDWDCDRYHVWGWLTLEPGECKTAIASDLSAKHQYYDFVQEAKGLTEDENFCVDPINKFDYTGSSYDATNCPHDRWRAFTRIKTGNYTDFTVTIQ